MAANRSAFILSEIRDVLDAEPSFTVTKVHRPNNSADITVYPYIVSQTHDSDMMESGAGDSTGQVELGLLFDAQAGNDAANAGLGTDIYASIVDKTENAFADYEAEIVATKPRDTHSSGNFRTVITGARVTGWDGHYDKAGNRIMVGARVLVSFWHIAL